MAVSAADVNDKYFDLFCNNYSLFMNEIEHFLQLVPFCWNFCFLFFEHYDFFCLDCQILNQN